ncbi:MAG: glycosyltransferase family A protein [Tepidisphaeraceae bacterium]|jgi:glycosyltransferase involved in cell wall biosynthesis
MAKPPLVSIVLPVYNGEKYIRLALDSVLSQTCHDWELIIVDDCSTDTTPKIIADYAARDARIRPIRHDTNKRLPGGLNTGHEAARGEFLTWTSDDNILRPNFLEELTGFLRSRPEIGFVYSDYALIDDVGAITEHRVVLSPEHLAHGCIVGASFLYRRSTWEKVGSYDPEMCLSEDFDYWMRCYRQTELAVLHKELYEYRMHAGSLTSQQRARQFQAAERVLRKNLPGLTRAPRRYRALGWLWVTGVAARRRDFAGATGAFARALLMAPGLTVGHFFRKVFGDGLKGRFSFDQ